MVKNTLNVGQISEGFVLDHIQAGRSMDIYKYLHLDQLDCCVAIIKNAKSNCMGKKDIMKIEWILTSLVSLITTLLSTLSRMRRLLQKNVFTFLAKSAM